MALSSSIIGSILEPAHTTVSGASVVVPQPVPITVGAPVDSVTASFNITLPGGAGTLLELWLSSSSTTTGTDDFDVTIDGVDVPFHQSLDPSAGEPGLHHHYVNSSAFQALSGSKAIVVTGSLGSAPELIARVCSGVDDASPIQSIAKYEVYETTSALAFPAVDVFENNLLSVGVRHDLSRTWDTFGALTSSHVGTRLAIAELAVAADATAQAYSISHSAGTANPRKTGLLIQYRAA